MDPQIVPFAILFIAIPLSILAYRLYTRREKRPVYEQASHDVRSLLTQVRQLLCTRTLGYGPPTVARLRLAADRLTLALSRRDISDHPHLRRWLLARAAILRVLEELERGQDRSLVPTLARKARNRVARALEQGRNRGSHAPRVPARSTRPPWAHGARAGAHPSA